MLIRRVFSLARAATFVLGLGLFFVAHACVAFAAPQQQGTAGEAHGWAILYEEDPSGQGQQFSGSVIWRTETVKVDGKPDELAARADVDIPSRGLHMTMSLKRNLDPSLPADHVIDLMFKVPGDFDAGGIANVPGVLMKANRQAHPAPLAGLAVKVTEGSFLFELSDALANGREHNRRLLLERSWFDIPVVYANQRRAILAIEKGGSGKKALRTVFMESDRAQR